MKRKDGFTLVEVLVSLAIIALIGTMMVNAYISSFRVSRSLYTREQTKLTLIEWCYYCSNNFLLPEKIIGNSIFNEIHIENINLFNDGVNSRLKTFFGPIDSSSFQAKYFDGTKWVIVSSEVKNSGAIEIKGVYPKILVSYNVIGWNYIKDRRFNYGNDIILSYVDFNLKYAVTDDGLDIPIQDINIINIKEGRIKISTNNNKWITLYYQIPKGIIFNITKPDFDIYSYNNNIITFNSDVQNHYILVSYNKKTEVIKCNSFNQAILSDNIDCIHNIKGLTIETQALWEGRKISYISAVQNNDL